MWILDGKALASFVFMFSESSTVIESQGGLQLLDFTRNESTVQGSWGTLNYLCYLISSIILIFPFSYKCTLTWRLPHAWNRDQTDVLFLVLLLTLCWFYMIRVFAFYLTSRMHFSSFSSVYSITSRKGVFPCSLWAILEDAILPFIPTSLQGHSSGGRVHLSLLGACCLLSL